MPEEPALSLRERKTARAKLAILDAVFARLKEDNLEAIQIKDICATAEVSEPSFYNYFPKKTDVLAYFVRLWSVDMKWRLSRREPDSTARSAIEDLFVESARQMEEHPGLMPETLAFLARQRGKTPLESLGAADKLLRFPGRNGIERISECGIDELFAPLVAQALRNGELSPALDPRVALYGLGVIFYGLPAILGITSSGVLGEAYLSQIGLLWKGLCARDEVPTPKKSKVKKDAAGKKDSK